MTIKMFNNIQDILMYLTGALLGIMIISMVAFVVGAVANWVALIFSGCALITLSASVILDSIEYLIIRD